MIRNPATMTQGYIGTWLLGWGEFFKIVTRPQLGRDGCYFRDFNDYICRTEENKRSILTAYPLTNIK